MEELLMYIARVVMSIALMLSELKLLVLMA